MDNINNLFKALCDSRFYFEGMLGWDGNWDARLSLTMSIFLDFMRGENDWLYIFFPKKKREG